MGIEETKTYHYIHSFLDESRESGITANPGNVCPAINSNPAPPPVEIGRASCRERV